MVGTGPARPLCRLRPQPAGTASPRTPPGTGNFTTGDGAAENAPVRLRRLKSKGVLMRKPRQQRTFLISLQKYLKTMALGGKLAAIARRLEVGLHFWRGRPQRRTTAALVLPAADTNAMSMHLAEISRRVSLGAHAKGGYHGAARLAVPSQHHARSPAAIRSRAEPDRECLGIFCAVTNSPSPCSKATTTTSSTNHAPRGASLPTTPNASPQSHPEPGERLSP